MTILLMIIALFAILILAPFATNTRVNDELECKLALKARYMSYFCAIFISISLGYTLCEYIIN